MIRKTHHPKWNEDFQFMLEEPPLNDKIHIEVMSKRTRFSFRSKVCLVILLLSPQFSSLVSKRFTWSIYTVQESLGFVEINLADVVHNGHINQKYHLIGSKNGVVHVELGWKKT